MKVEVPLDEPERLKVLYSYEILDTPPEQAFDDLTRLAAHICQTPIALLSLVDANRQWFKSSLGLQTHDPLNGTGFCAHTILQQDVLVVADARADERFAGSPWIVSTHEIRFYAGAPLMAPERQAIGTLCVMDYIPRQLDSAQIEALRTLAHQAIVHLELKRSLRGLEHTLDERQKLEQELRMSVTRHRDSEERFRNLFERVPDGVFQSTRDGRLLTANPTLLKMLGYESKEELIAVDLENLYVDPEQRTRLTNKLEAEGELRNAELVLKRKDGQHLVVLENARVVYDVTGVISCYEGTLTDITERKKIEQSKDELISIVSHELRTPLTSIQGSLAYLYDRVASIEPDKARKLVELASRSSQRMMRLINDMLDVDKIESGKMVFRLKPLEITTIVQHAVEVNQPYADQFGVKLVLEQTLDGARVSADSDRIMQVITNLLSNAAKFSPPNGTVSVSVLRRGEYVRVSVMDRGSGVPEKFRGQVFQKFAQADTSTSRQYKGSGLGLSISKAIVERLGGAIGFDSEPGSETTFYFELPEIVSL